MRRGAKKKKKKNWRVVWLLCVVVEEEESPFLFRLHFPFLHVADLAEKSMKAIDQLSTGPCWEKCWRHCWKFVIWRNPANLFLHFPTHKNEKKAMMQRCASLVLALGLCLALCTSLVSASAPLLAWSQDE